MRPSRPAPGPATPLLVALAVGVPLLACLLMSTARGSVSQANAVLVLALLVVCASLSGRRVVGLAAALSSTAWFDFFLVEPYGTFAIARRDGVETAVLLTLVGVAVTEVVHWGLRQQAQASGRSGYLDGIAAAATAAAEADVAPAALAEVVGRQVAEVLGAESCVLRAGPPAGHPRLELDGTVTRDGRPVAVDRSGLPTDDVLELPVRSGGVTHATFVISCATRAAWPDLERRRVAVTLAEQVAPALARGGPDALRASRGA